MDHFNYAQLKSSKPYSSDIDNLRRENARLREELAEQKSIVTSVLQEKSVSDGLEKAGLHKLTSSASRVVADHLLSSGWAWTG